MRITLVGAEIEENLSIRSIAAYLLEQGHEVRLAAFSSSADTLAVLDLVNRFQPHVVGLSMVFQLRADEFMDLATALRVRGYAGHVTCGGHFATFNPEGVLAACPAIDSVVRHEGEAAMAEMARVLCEGGDLGDVAGLVLRTADGQTRRAPSRRPPDDLDPLPFPVRDPAAPTHLGIPVASLVGSRGCYANCAFCCINAWHRASGGRRLRQRTPANVVAEMARLHHERGVRLFIFHDDNFFVPSKEKNLRRFHGLQKEMRAAGLRDVGLVVKARPNDVDREVFELLLEMGLVRVYLGIENGSEGGLAALNRLVGVEQNEQALEVIRALGVFACFNLLVFEPDTRLEHVADNIAFMRRHLDVPHNYCRTEAYTASALHTRLAGEGRLGGNWLAPDYVISDPRTEALFRIFAVALYERNFGAHSSANTVMGTKYHLHLLRRFHPEAVSDRLEERVREVVLDSNRVGADLLSEALAFVSERLPAAHEAAEFALDLARRAAADNHAINLRLAALDAEMHRLAQPRSQPSRLKAAAMLPVLALSLLSAGCESKPTVVDPAPPPTASPSHRPTASPSVPPPVDMAPPPSPPPHAVDPPPRPSTPQVVDPPPPPHPPVDPVPPPTVSPSKRPTPRASVRPGRTPSAVPPVVDPVPPPVVDPVPPPSPRKTHGPTGMLPRAVQGVVTVTREQGAWRLRTSCGPGRLDGQTWRGDDGLTLRWGASDGTLTLHPDGSATVDAPAGALAWCEARTPEGGVWLSSRPL